METENNNLKYQMKKAASYCKTPTALLKGPQLSLELKSFRHEVNTVKGSLRVLGGSVIVLEEILKMEKNGVRKLSCGSV